ncbi:MAG: hypothetical protein F2812_14685 [Actinobacteria bacterium]|nr:hypothetical protein [Actinomycetota bacterium]
MNDMSRPREIDPETNQVRMVGVPISVANHDALKAEANARGITMAAVVRPLIERELRRSQRAAKNATT